MSKGPPLSFSEGKKFATSSAGHITATEHIGERRPLSSIPPRRRKRNPFYERQRNNFPDFDNAFKSTSSSSLVDNDKSIDDENGFDNFSDVEGSSILNMSIGGRAALNEHARHVEKFGIDGENNLEGNSDSDERYPRSDTNLFLDNQWETFLDSSRVDCNGKDSIAGEITTLNSTTNSNFGILYSSGERFGYDESIEVMTDVSHDYFNSSRVNLLTTPERNKNRRVEVMTRNGEDTGDDQVGQGSWFESDDSYCNDEDDHATHFNQSGQSHQEGYDFDLQGSSFNMGDISRISNAVSDINRTPDTSRISDENHAATHTIFRTISPPWKATDSSFSSIPAIRETEPLLSSDSNDLLEFHFNPSANNRRGNIQKENVPLLGSKENVLPDKSDSSTSSIQSTVSNFMTEARSMAKQMVSDVEQSIGAFESLPGDFLRSMDISRVDPPSPILQDTSTPSTSRQEGIKLRNGEKSLSVGSSSIGTVSKVHNTSSSSSSAAGDAMQTNLTGRKRYRTVVPRRVYLDSLAQHSNEEQDSFAARSNPETTATCLLESFEEVATLHTL